CRHVHYHDRAHGQCSLGTVVASAVVAFKHGCCNAGGHACRSDHCQSNAHQVAGSCATAQNLQCQWYDFDESCETQAISAATMPTCISAHRKSYHIRVAFGLVV